MTHVQQQRPPPPPASSVLFPSKLMHLSVLQICKDSQFESCETHAAEALTNTTIHVLKEIGRQSAENAEYCQRSTVNIFDVLRSLRRRRMTIRDLISFLETSTSIVVPVLDAIAFPQPSPQTAASRANQPLVNQRKPDHIPHFLPPFPDLHTYSSTVVYEPMTFDDLCSRRDEAQHRPEVQKSLHRMKTGGGDSDSSQRVFGDTLLLRQEYQQSTRQSKPSAREWGPFLKPSLLISQKRPREDNDDNNNNHKYPLAFRCRRPSCSASSIREVVSDGVWMSAQEILSNRHGFLKK